MRSAEVAGVAGIGDVVLVDLLTGGVDVPVGLGCFVRRDRELQIGASRHEIEVDTHLVAGLHAGEVLSRRRDTISSDLETIRLNGGDAIRAVRRCWDGAGGGRRGGGGGGGSTWKRQCARVITEEQLGDCLGSTAGVDQTIDACIAPAACRIIVESAAGARLDENTAHVLAGRPVGLVRACAEARERHGELSGVERHVFEVAAFDPVFGPGLAEGVAERGAGWATGIEVLPRGRGVAAAAGHAGAGGVPAVFAGDQFGGWVPVGRGDIPNHAADHERGGEVAIGNVDLEGAAGGAEVLAAVGVDDALIDRA